MIKLLSLFSGIGAFEKALDRVGIKYELVNYCEIDKYASKAYSLIHGVDEEMNLGDITKVDTSKLGEVDLITYGFPCQDISMAGKRQGFEDSEGNRTRSGLFFEAMRIIEDTKPKFAICENVKALTQKRFENEFATVLQSLEDAGYSNYWQVLNAKDYGIPQNRERVFIISIRKDIDKGFTFPKPFPLELRLKDVLEDVVDEKFYLKETQEFFIKNSFQQEMNGNGFRFEPHIKDNADVAKTITTRSGGRMDDNFVCDIKNTDKKTFKFDSTNEMLTEPKIIQVGNLMEDKNFKNPQCGRVYSADGLAPTLNTCGGGQREPKIIDDIYNSREPRVYEEYAPAIRAERTGLKVAEPVCAASRGRYIKNADGETITAQHLEINDTGTTNALTTVQKDNYIIEPATKKKKRIYGVVRNE